MAQKTKKRQEQSYQTVIPVKKYLGMNAHAEWSHLGPDESRYLSDWDIFAGEDGDYMQTRRGSQYLKAASGATKRGSTPVVNQITWDVGSEEYLITQEGTGMYAQALLVPANPVAIALAIGGAFALGSTAQTDLFISGDKLYVFHPSANYVIRWNGTAFIAYPMGFGKTFFVMHSGSSTGTFSGRYIYGVERVYRVNGVDLMASTPNRKRVNNVIADSGTVTNVAFVILEFKTDELENDLLWTHLRIWRTKNMNSATTDILNPIDVQGNQDELYELALITRAESIGVLGAPAANETLPPGNAGVTCGKVAGTYTVTDANPDSRLFNLVGIDRIELLPIPACTTGCFAANRIFFSGVQDAALDDASKSNIWYSNYAGTKYAFQYNPLNFVDTGRDGQNMIKLIAFEKDVIGIKEAKTGRLPSGNVDIPFQTLDDRIGINHKNMATFIPGVGLVAVTNDYGDFRIFGYDLRWTSTLNGLEISKPVRSYTSAFTGGSISFAYINGKLLICYGLSNVLALHANEKRGWTLYRFQSAQVATRLFTFAQNTRAALVAHSTHLVEIEVSGQNGDIATSSDTQGTTIAANEITHCFQSRGGKDILEHECLNINAKANTATNITVYPKVNTLDWPVPGGLASVNAVPSPTIHAANTALADMEYKVYFQPSTVGTLKWCPMAGNFLAYDITMYSPSTMRSKELMAAVDQNGIGYGAFDPFNTFPTTNTDPTWAQ